MVVQGRRNESACVYANKIRSWDQHSYYICEPSICRGSMKMQTLSSIQRNQTRFNSAKLNLYLQDLKKNLIDGWLDLIHIRLVYEFTKYQHSLGIHGTVGEIGLFHGKFFYSIVGFAQVEEPAIGIDLYINQLIGPSSSSASSSNITDTSTKPPRFTKYFSDHTTVNLLGKDSKEVFPRDFLRYNLPRIRLFSIDGSHTMESTLRDLNLIACMVMDGGIVILDDFHNNLWLGVTTAALLFSSAQERLVPFFMNSNKLYFTTPSHHQSHLNHVRSLSPLSCLSALDKAQTSIGPWEVIQCATKAGLKTETILNAITVT
eukprot:gene3058-5992_t